MVETETIDRLFLELSQFTNAKTKRELELESCVRQDADEISQLKARIDELENSLPFYSNRDRNKAREALGEVYRHSLSDEKYPEIGVVEVIRARDALVQSYAECNALNTRIAELESQGKTLREVAELAAGLRRGCTCGYDDRCGNCDRIVRITELAKRALPQLTPPSDRDAAAADRTRVAES